MHRDTCMGTEKKGWWVSLGILPEPRITKDRDSSQEKRKVNLSWTCLAFESCCLHCWHRKEASLFRPSLLTYGRRKGFLPVTAQAGWKADSIFPWSQEYWWGDRSPSKMPEQLTENRQCPPGLEWSRGRSYLFYSFTKVILEVSTCVSNRNSNTCSVLFP